MTRILPLVLFLLLSSPVLAEGGQWEKEARYGQRWIVHLEDAPTLEYTGPDSAKARPQGAAGPMLQATAPGVTGRPFDLNDAAIRAYSEHLDGRHERFIAEAGMRLGRTLVPVARLRHTLNSVILEVDPAEAAVLEALPGVVGVERERMYSLQLSSGPRQIGAPAVWGGTSQLPAARGEGIVVGVIDSGINWNHRAFSDDPADSAGFIYENPLGERLGLCGRSSVQCNDKLIGVYDFTSQSTDGLDKDGHGTHVAAIAVANEWEPGQAGVANRANLVSYRVCLEQDPEDDDSGGCQGSAIRSALEQAVMDGVDVVNFSIGSPDSLNPWTSSTARQALNVRDAGITFVTSGGNEGPGRGTVGWPAEAPWALAVGSSTTSACAMSRIEVEGQGTRSVRYGTGPNDSAAALGFLPIRRGEAFDGNSLGCTAFPAGAFDNSTALLERGDCTFEVKVGNAEAAGARAVLIFNNVADGAICMAGLETTNVPAAAMTRSDGLDLDRLVRDNAGQRARFAQDSLADQVSSFSSRGPSDSVPGVMKPNVLAPGQGIEAAYIPGSDDVAGLTGTSMASPHVAGAVALLRQLNPGLKPDQATSIIETTAEAQPVTVSGEPASIHDRGAGRVRVDLAARAGLYLPVTRSEFLAANPALGGDLRQLNLPGMVNEHCGSQCTFTRTVRALRAGSWSVSAEGEPDIEVSPSSFSLQPGESRQLTITIRPAPRGNTALQDGAVVLTPSSLSAPVPGVVQLATQRLPIGVRSTTGEVNLPERVAIDAASRQGRHLLGLGFVDDLPEAVFRTSGIVVPVVEEFRLPQDSDNSDPYDDSAGTKTFLVDVPEGAMALWAETTASSAPDIDLFVGRDANRDGRAQESEERCRSITPDELERCVITNPTPGTWWVVVQNWASSSALDDSVRLELAVLKEEQSPSLTAFGPGRHQAGPLEIEVFWDDPSLRAGERVLGVVGVSSRRDQSSDVGIVPLVIQLDRRAPVSTTVVFPGETVPVAVPGGGRHDRLVFDVPPTASSIEVTIEGEADVSGSLRRVPFASIRETAPATPAPAGPVLASGSGSASGFRLARSGNVEPGRYFIELDNSSASDRVVQVTVAVQDSAAVVPRFGFWAPVGTESNPRQDIAQGIEWQKAGDGFALWYSYEPGGLPVFYLGQAALDPNSSVWAAEVSRYTIGDANQLPDVAGVIGITAVSEEEMIFSWRLNGGHGSDIKMNFNAATCPMVDGEPVSYTGTWFTPGQDQGGSSVVVTDNAQGHIRYYYDGLGVGRWVLATDGGGAPLSEEMELFEFRGFCPNCESTEVSSEVVGVYSRSYEGENDGIEAMEFVSRPPLGESISIEVPISKLSTRVPCP